MRRRYKQSWTSVPGRYVYVCRYCHIKRVHTGKHPVYWHDCKGPLGLGDRVEQLLKWLGFKKSCGGCQKRKHWLNGVSEYAKSYMVLWGDYLRTKGKGWFTTKDTNKSS